MEKEKVLFEQFVSRGCGLDVHKKEIVATISGRGIKRETRKFGATTSSLTELKEWLLEHGITHVAMESTGVYWKPVLNILEPGGFTILVVNARHIKYVPGHKTDKKDSKWICKLLLAGLLKGSYVPGVEQRNLRDLTRYRKRLVEQQAAEKNRMIRIFEDANLKLSSVFSDVNGVTCTKVINSIISGKDDPEELITLCKHRNLKTSAAEIKEAIRGHMTDHHRFMLSIIRDDINQTQKLIDKLDVQIEEQMLPYADELARLSEIPGVGEHTAKALIAEIGVDMAAFPTESHLASWAGMCPGNNESAGKKKSSRTTHGNKHVKALLTEAAWGASRSKDTYLSIRYQKVAARRGKKRAIVAVGHSILRIAYHILKGACCSFFFKKN
jgi:transposase